MTNEQLVEQSSTFTVGRLCAPSIQFFDGENAIRFKPTGELQIGEGWAENADGAAKAILDALAKAFPQFILAAREEGARAMQEACAQDAATWFPAGSESRYPASGVVASIRALDPAKIAGGSDAESD